MPSSEGTGGNGLDETGTLGWTAAGFLLFDFKVDKARALRDDADTAAVSVAAVMAIVAGC
jgi:hypothetical protein